MIEKKNIYRVCTGACLLTFLMTTTGGYAADSYSPYADQTYPTTVYFGDTHLHTNLSFDAYNSGTKILGAEEAYRFAKGENVLTDSGQMARLKRPLDFLVIANHAGNMGAMKSADLNDPAILRTETGRKWAEIRKEVNRLEKTDIQKAIDLSVDLWMNQNRFDDATDDAYKQTIWQDVIRLADRHNTPGQFTAFSGFEWTGYIYNLHRVVIFEDEADKTGQVRPLSYFDTVDPEDLWEYLASYEEKTGGSAFAIPHNGNLSTGVMFALQDAKGNPLSSDYAATRSRWEPLYEMTQIKGDSETHPAVSPDDEFADFEKFPQGKLATYEAYKKDININIYDSWVAQYNMEDEKSDRLQLYEYARPALKLGLQQQNKLGINPFKFGMIGSTDAHSSLAAADENNFWGKWAETAPNEKRILHPWRPKAKSGTPGWRMSAAGYAAVWATENTRKSLFAAMKRKETYATTGPRMTVRFFGGWDYEKADAVRPDLARIGYSGGVPMGGDLTHAPKGQAPKFLIRAVKDPDGANLDRVQVIKGWHDQNGALHEKIYNVALSDGRKDRGPKTQKVGSTVDVPDARYTNTIGDPELATVWTDPDFDKDELAFYYVRVLEIPTPRWTAYDANFFGLKNIPEEVPMVIQERAYTSPIWYTP